MVLKNLVVDLGEDEWRDVMVIRALAGANSWNEFFNKLVSEPAGMILSLLKQRKLIDDMLHTIGEIERGEIEVDPEMEE